MDPKGFMIQPSTFLNPKFKIFALLLGCAVSQTQLGGGGGGGGGGDRSLEEEDR